MWSTFDIYYEEHLKDSKECWDQAFLEQNSYWNKQEQL